VMLPSSGYSEGIILIRVTCTLCAILIIPDTLKEEI